MCLRPVTISHDFSDKISKLKALNFIGRYEPGKLNTLQVPCGHCEECIKTRQNHHAYKLYQRINNLSCCYHITLTYRPESLPFALSQNFIDHSTGEVFRCSRPSIIDDSSALTSLREWYRLQLKSSSPVYLYSQSINYDDYEIENVITPSLNRSDVREALKIQRIYFKRRYGRNVNLVYSFCGEYGPSKCRPHYHCILASKEDITDFVNMFSNYWQQRFGFTVVKKVNRINDNHTDGYELVCKYLSKYISKGDFECDSVKYGYAEPGRVCQSQGLDPRLKESIFEEELVPYFRAYDLYGKYSPISMTLENGRKLSVPEITNLCDEIIKRSHVSLGLSKVSIPRYLKEAIFYFKNVNGKLRSAGYQLSEEEIELRKKVPERFSTKVIRSPLSYLVSYRFQFLQDQNRAKDLERIKKRGPESFIKVMQSSLEYRANRFKKNYKDFLSGSFSSQ